MEINSIYNKTVLVRVGFDIPNYTSLERIYSSFETIRLLLSNNNKLILVTKWGRPVNFNPELSTRKMLDLFSKEFSRFLFNYTTQAISDTENLTKKQNISLIQEPDINFLDQFEVGFLASNEIIAYLPRNSITLLENVYFDEREYSNKPEERLILAESYSRLADVYVDECFISSHRKDCTNTEIKEFLPHSLGLHYETEVDNLNYFLESPKGPFLLVLGGAKLATKLPLLESLLPKVDKVLLGGTICFPFLNVMGKIKTKCNEIELDIARNIMEKYEHKLVLAEDFVPSLDQAKDIGLKSIEIFKEHLKTAKSIFWNGPLGQYEEPEFAVGTLEMANFIANLNVHSVLGGGDSVAAIPENILNKFTYVSLGGGATLEYLSKG